MTKLHISRGRRRRAALGVLAVAVASLVAYTGVAASAATKAATAVTVKVSTASNGKVGTGFAGFSYEKDRIGAGMFDAGDTDLVNLFKLLGPSVLRLGGNLVDMTKWNASGKGGNAKEIAPADVKKLKAFLDATGWKAIYGVNLKAD